ncbi:DUF7933 domain-containing protein [Amycolatopsis thermoflava]|uniref:DUF7933 domain-containing protein n=1 Tax=Amycolatopsis thermoflava TaxID=84480 RepID=UPI0012F93A85|nr:DUF11 domain-containing protein [Amycolatopsis thermoflava]
MTRPRQWWKSSMVRRAGAVAGVAAVVAAAGASFAMATTPGSPGTPQAPTTIYAENFQNRPAATPIVRLNQYTGAGGQRYGADPQWLSMCNGWIASSAQPVAPAAQVNDCSNQGTWNAVQQMAYALGSYTGVAPNSNYAVSAMTAGNPGAPHVEFKTASNIPFSGSNRFVTFSVDVAVINCFANHPLLQFSLLDEAGRARPVGSQIDGCGASRTINVPQIGSAPAKSATVGTYTSNGAVLVNGSSIGVQMVNNQPSGTGNDHAFDNIKILDVTPQLDKSFSPVEVNTGGTSTLTFTITNTSELAAKNGWSFTDALPAGLTVAGAGTTNCPSGAVTAAAGATSVSVTGNLTAGMASCTVSVPVTSGTAGSYTNGPGNMSLVGLNPPADTTVTFVEPDPSADLALSKTAPQDEVRPGDRITYTITVMNLGPAESSGYTVTDPIPAGLVDVQVPAGCSVGSDSVIICTGGPLAAGDSVSYEISGTVDAVNPDGVAKYLTNAAQVTGNDPDGDPSNNTGSKTVRVVPLVSLAIGGVGALAGAAAWVLRRRSIVN